MISSSSNKGKHFLTRTSHLDNQDHSLPEISNLTEHKLSDVFILCMGSFQARKKPRL